MCYDQRKRLYRLRSASPHTAVASLYVSYLLTAEWSRPVERDRGGHHISSYFCKRVAVAKRNKGVLPWNCMTLCHNASIC